MAAVGGQLMIIGTALQTTATHYSPYAEGTNDQPAQRCLYLFFFGSPSLSLRLRHRREHVIDSGAEGAIREELRRCLLVALPLLLFCSQETHRFRTCISKRPEGERASFYCCRSSARGGGEVSRAPLRARASSGRDPRPRGAGGGRRRQQQRLRRSAACGGWAGAVERRAHASGLIEELRRGSDAIGGVLDEP